MFHKTHLLFIHSNFCRCIYINECDVMEFAFNSQVHILSEMGENPSTDLVAFFETMKPTPRLPCLSLPE